MVGYGPESRLPSSQFSLGSYSDEHSSPINSEKDTSVSIRPYQDQRDCHAVVEIAQGNFRLYYTLLPKDVVDAYIAANRAVDLKAAVRADGTEAHVAQTPDGKIAGFCLLRYNPYTRRDPQGELQLIRLHVAPNSKGQSVGKKLLEFTEKRGKEIGVEFVVSLASGSSRPFFEQNGWNGRTELRPMPKRKTSALVYAAQKRLISAPIPLSEPPTHIVYAGTNSTKEHFVRKLLTIINPNLAVYSAPTEEDPTEDVFEAARSKALGVRLNFGRNIVPLVISSDVRTELLRIDLNSPTRYALVNKGKPNSSDSIEEIRANFALLRDTALQTKRPVPYVVRSVTYLHNPREPDMDSFTEHDTSIWLSREGLEELSTSEGLKRYIDEVNSKFGVDITKMSAGFAFLVFLDRGYVVGLNGHPFDSLPRRDEVVEKSRHTVLTGIDESLIKRRLGYTQS
ncbi:MAG: GNAT family N-acetyltransferase [Candidatus Levybacteria bacterium]|nr:GNAT family N-acetyltransferase [Candidatus Levybacteria bacterium]MBI2196958.1 GNAT family N-acetyltransferase [Candidatus Daviesbacteria bacterium]MBI2622718.1 GNAT family N-acetyltransferase [Candidatus Levybacteria bacterium]MBI3070205.1 GNAT family N-acetyltransferase [Candidatus Levybacteria bacterium]MBI3092931.1 GNAT family N-acetyltransferase [Candidatus Levybacteria bacterium]